VTAADGAGTNPTGVTFPKDRIGIELYQTLSIAHFAFIMGEQVPKARGAEGAYSPDQVTRAWAEALFAQGPPRPKPRLQRA
jgi:hypothetical protein